MRDDESVSDPKENPISNGHLPVSGEIGGPVSYHDPATTDTSDEPEDDPMLDLPSSEADEQE